MAAAPVIKLAQHPNIIGLKDSSGDLQKMALIIRETGPSFQVLAGSTGYLLAAMVIGAVGGIGALANIAARPLDRLMTCARSGAIEEARAIQLRLVEANLAVTARYGVAGLKAALELCGRPAGVVREPLLPLDAEEKAAVRAILMKAELIPARSGVGEDGSAGAATVVRRGRSRRIGAPSPARQTGRPLPEGRGVLPPLPWGPLGTGGEDLCPPLPLGRGRRVCAPGEGAPILHDLPTCHSRPPNAPLSPAGSTG
jgi:hypothetical protein